jgi:hypothetical protein
MSPVSISAPEPHGAELRDGPRDHRWGFGAFLLAEGVFLVSSILIGFVLTNPRSGASALSAVGLVVSLIVPTVLAAGVGVAITVTRGRGPVLDLGLRPTWRDIGIGAACGGIGTLVGMAASVIWSRLVGGSNANSAVGEAFDAVHLPPVLAVLLFLDVWLVAPLCEEVLYRGLLWGAMERRGWNRWVVLAVVTTVFAIGHFELLRTPLLLIIGLPIGFARMITGRLVAGVVAHQLNNLLPALGLLLATLGVHLL